MSFGIVQCRLVPLCVIQRRSVSFWVVQTSFIAIRCHSAWFGFIQHHSASFSVVRRRSASFCVVLCRSVSFCVVLCRSAPPPSCTILLQVFLDRPSAGVALYWWPLPCVGCRVSASRGRYRTLHTSQRVTRRSWPVTPRQMVWCVTGDRGGGGGALPACWSVTLVRHWSVDGLTLDVGRRWSVVGLLLLFCVAGLLLILVSIWGRRLVVTASLLETVRKLQSRNFCAWAEPVSPKTNHRLLRLFFIRKTEGGFQQRMWKNNTRPKKINWSTIWRRISSLNTMLYKW